MNTHLIFLADEIGMASVFPELKSRLADNSDVMITLLYYLHDDNTIFLKELNILEKHFPSRLYISYESFAPGKVVILNQDNIEAVINANTAVEMKFIVSAGKAFTENAIDLLRFLGIEHITIQEQFFSY
ncbi:hypothetical protein [Chitinophaga tropicalis]|uniref:Uncharacterized protein n=1 Tax=Chitinophaga tropicalis TaxID=2683588 RepID=A0A7K1U330_9BACT|nr:hypothetical protein [Chitinophaga tropicalis]MVT08720.1 hypothetical protein [Chitinophaga tropicalis]